MYAKANHFQKLIDMKITTTTNNSSYDPDAFGPAFWFTLHNSAGTYPNKPTKVIQQSMKELITNLPLLVPCLTCKEHFYNFIKYSNLDIATANRENLFRYFVDVHNYVNKRVNKKTEMSLNDAKKIYGFDKPTGSSIRITYGPLIN
jgi:hypothetical protein